MDRGGVWATSMDAIAAANRLEKDTSTSLSKSRKAASLVSITNLSRGDESGEEPFDM